jgi:cupin superfamily protein
MNTGEDLLARLTADPAALRHSWPKEPYVFHGDPAWARSLLSFGAVDSLLADGVLDGPKVMMANGELLERQAFAAGTDIKLAAVAAKLRDGSTLLLHQLEKCHRPLTGFCRELAAVLGHPVQANAYLTPPGAQGFVRHWDGHHVFMIQAEGGKTWQVCEPPEPGELGSGPLSPGGIPAGYDGKAVLETELRPGDVLWVPSGWIHSGRTGGQWSLHVSIGVKQLTRHRLLLILLQAASRDLDLPAALPPGIAVDQATAAAAVANLRQALCGWLEEQDNERLAARLAPVLRRSLGDPVVRPVSTAMSGRPQSGAAAARVSAVSGER